MKSTLIFTFIVLLTTGHALASGNYKNQTRQSPPVTRQPYEKSEKSLKGYIYDIKRKNVSIHNVSLNGKTFQIKGNFSNQADFDNFIEHLRGNGEVNREIEVKKNKGSFAGSSSYDFEITGLNVWK